MLEIGDIVPDFRANSTEGPVHLYEYKGKKHVVLIFYPLNNTSVCRKQLCAARDAREEYAKRDAVVFGVNPGKFEGHEKFARKNQFGFPLIHDENWQLVVNFKVLTLFGVMQARTVVVLDKQMAVRYIYKGFAETEDILQVLDELNAK